MREYVFHFVQDGCALWFVFHLRDALKFLQKLPLTFGQLGRRLYPDFYEQVSLAVPVQHGNAFAAQLKYGSRLRAFGDFQGLFAFESRNLNLCAHGRLGERNWYYTIQVIALAIKECVLLDAQHEVEISGGTAVDAGFADSREANACSIFDPGRNFGIDRFLPDHATFAPAVRARVADYAACAMTRRAGASNTEESLLISNLSAPAAGAATGGSFALGAPRTVTLLAKFMLAVGNLFFYPEGRLFEFDSDVFPQIGATLRSSSSSRTSSAEEVAEPEEFAEDVAEILEDGGIESAARYTRANAGVAEAVVHLALLGVRQHSIGLAALLELFFGVRIVGVAVRMVLQRKLAISALYLLISRLTLDAQNFVVISFYARQFAPLAVSYERRASKVPLGITHCSPLTAKNLEV